MTNTDQDLKTRLLGKSFILQALDERTQGALAARARVQTYKAGEQIFSTGSSGSSMMAIAEGAVRISTLSPTARNVVLADLATGEVFGEVAMLDGGERSADAHASTNCTLIILERRALFEVLKEKPDFALHLIELLCGRLRRSDQRMMEFAFLQLPARIAKTLLRVSQRSGEGGPPLAKLALSQLEIADMIGGSRENVNRCLRTWQKTGLIDLKEGWLVICDRDGLERLADGS